MYLADHVDPGIFDLYAVPTDGSRAPLRLTRAEAADQHIQSYVFTPDGRGVVFQSDWITDRTRLWHVPLDGSRTPIELALATEVTGKILPSPDSTRVFHFGTDGHLWSVATDGTTLPLRLTNTTIWVQSMTVSADGTRLVVGVSPGPFADATSLLSVPTDGSRAVVTLVPAGDPLSDQFLPRITPDQRWVVFGAGLSYATGFVHRVALDGSGPALRISTGTVWGIDQSPDGKELAIYQRVGTGLSELALVRIADGQLRSLDRSPAASAEVRFTPDGSALLFRASQSFSPAPLWILHLERHAPATLGRPSWRVLSPDAGGFQISPQGTHVAYWEGLTLFSIGLRPDDKPVALGTLSDHPERLTFRPDGANLLVEITDRTPGDELFSVPVDGSRPLASLAPGLQVSQAFLDGSARNVVVHGRLDPTAFELFTVPEDASLSPQRLNDPPPSYHYPIGKFDFTQDGARVLYTAQTTPSRVGLFSVPADGSLPAVELAHMRTTRLLSHATSADGRTAYFVGARVFLTLLYRVATDGSTWPERLVDFSARRVLPTFKITPDGAHIVYLSTEIDEDIVDLFSVPADGSQARVQLSRTSADVNEDFQLTADGTRVVYRSSSANLRSVPTLGGSAPIDLAPTAVRFELSPDGAHVVFQRADSNICLVPVDGSSPVVVLGPNSVYRIGQESERVLLANGRGVTSLPIAGGASVTLSSLPGYELLVGGGGAFFRAGPTPADSDLYAAAVDGSLGTRLLNPPRAPGTYPSLGFLALPARRLVYQVQGPSATTTPTLMSVRFDGSAPVQLNRPRGTNGPSLTFQPTPDFARVMYLGDDEFTRVQQLYTTPVSGGTSVRLNDPLPDQGDVAAFRIGPTGRALYLADQESPQVFELYSVEVP